MLTKGLVYGRSVSVILFPHYRSVTKGQTQHQETNINTEVLDKTINISEKFCYNLKMKESVILSTNLTG